VTFYEKFSQNKRAMEDRQKKIIETPSKTILETP
jgi:hypothetical protein